MANERFEVEQGFYRACAELLGVAHSYRPFAFRRPTRWNNRTPGNGRFPGFGLIRLFGDSVHMHLRAPEAVNRRFASQEEALNFLGSLRTGRGSPA